MYLSMMVIWSAEFKVHIVYSVHCQALVRGACEVLLKFLIKLVSGSSQVHSGNVKDHANGNPTSCRFDTHHTNQADYWITRHFQHQDRYKSRTRNGRISNAEKLYDL